MVSSISSTTATSAIQAKPSPNARSADGDYKTKGAGRATVKDAGW